MARDGDFSDKVKKQLQERVAHHCSNPDCGIQTISPKKSDNTGIMNGGEAGHICAVKPNGARYNPKMTVEECKSIENGIWLCSVCHHTIDTDPKSYSVELLKEWKTQAELKALNNYKKRPKTQQDINEAQQSLLSVMPLKSISEAIKNVHSSVDVSLEKLDPRFNIHSNYANGKTSFVIQPNADDVEVKFSIEMDNSNKPLFEELFKHGKPISLKNIGQIQTDSELINHFFINKNFTKLIVSPTKKIKSHIQFYTKDENFKGEHIQILEGEITHGIETYSFSGSIGNIIHFNINKMPLDLGIANEQDTFKVSLDLNFESWENCELRSLNNVEEVFNFLRLINHDDVHAKLFANGYQFASVTVNSFKKFTSSNILLYVAYVFKASKICKILNYPAYLPKDCTIIMEEYDFISEVYENLIKKRVVKYNEVVSNTKMTFLITEDNFDIFNNILTQPRLDYEFKLTNEDNLQISFFNQKFELPPREWWFRKFKVKLNRQNIRLGDSIKMTLVPYKESTYTLRYKL